MNIDDLATLVERFLHALREQERTQSASAVVERQRAEKQLAEALETHRRGRSQGELFP